jgi:glycosyltransferase involved in cell wall biosynthesis
MIQTSEGVGGARNDGVNAATTPYIATTDADIRLPDGWLEIMLKHFESDEEVVAVVGPDGPIEKTWKSRVIFSFLRNVIYPGGYKSLPHSDDVEIGFRLMKMGKIVYDKEQFVELSVRRMEKDGYVNTLLTWLKGDLRIMFGLDIAGRGYAKQKY